MSMPTKKLLYEMSKMRPTRSFLNGTINIEDINDAQALILNKIEFPYSPRAFQVKAAPSNDVVYWSFSRRKANNYIRKNIAQRGLSIFFSDTLAGKSLDYNYRHSPNEYLFSFALYFVIAAISVSSPMTESFFTCFMSFLAIISLIKSIKSRKAYDKSKAD